jgi:hypothetical protein
MPNIDRLNGVTATNITSVDNHNASAIASINGQALVTSTLLLDVYGANVEAAYSVRKLSASYAGSAIRVRRSSDNSEQDIGFDGNGDLDTSALTTFVGANDGKVVKWYDQSGNSSDAVQTNVNGQPHIIASGVLSTQGGKPAVAQETGVGNPGNQFLDTPTINAVHNFVTLYQRIVGSVRAYYAQSANQFVAYDGFRIDYKDNVNATIQGVLNVRDTYLLSEVKVVGGTATSIINGSTDASGTANVLQVEAIMGYPTAGGGMIGKMQEMIFFSADKSSDAAAISTDINTYYSIYP